MYLVLFFLIRRVYKARPALFLQPCPQITTATSKQPVTTSVSRMPSVAVARKPVKKVSKVSKPAAKPALKASKPVKKAAKKVPKQPVESEPSKSYKELIVEGLSFSKDRKGISRPALKKFIREHYPKLALSPNFDLYFNNAVKKGVESGDFDQPKGPSGTLKLIKHPAKKSPSPQEKAAPKKVSSPSADLTYKEMIANAIAELNNGKGASRSALKKYVRDHNPSTSKSSANFDHLFSTALKKGVDSGEYAQPKGPTGIVKIVKVKTKGKTTKNHTAKKAA